MSADEIWATLFCVVASCGAINPRAAWFAIALFAFLWLLHGGPLSTMIQ